MSDITVKEIEAIKPTDKRQKVKCSKGLYLKISTTGEKTFFIRYSIGGAQKEYHIPEVFSQHRKLSSISLSSARELAAKIISLSKSGIDYKTQQTQTVNEQSLTVNDLFKDWYPTTNRKDGGVELSRYFNNMLPVIGSHHLSQITEGDIKTLLQKFSKAGHNRKAILHLNALKQMFKWGEGRKPYKLVIDNPTSSLKALDIVEKNYKEVERERALSISEVRDLFVKFKNEAQLVPQTEIALRLYLACSTRGSETLKARWSEVDLINKTWHIPEENTKGKSGSHTVYLSDYAVTQFKRLKKYSNNSEWCFPNSVETSHIDVRTVAKQVGDRQRQNKQRKEALTGRTKLQASLVLSGGDWVPHDLRRTSATLMQELGVPEHIIERALNHSTGSKIQRTYQRYDYSKELKKAWQLLGKELNKLG
jgi:integrase